MVDMAAPRPRPQSVSASVSRAVTARDAGLAGCRECGRVAPLGTPACPRCGAALHSRTPQSLQRVLAWLTVGLMCYLPANLLPMLRTRTLGRETDSTILGGVVDLLHHGAWDIAFVVFFALSVAFTMLSAQSLDPRLIWDSAEPEPPADD